MQDSAPLPPSSSLRPTHRSWAIRFVVGPYTSLLGLTRRRWVVRFVVGLYASSLGCTLRRWAVRFVAGPYASLLGHTLRCWALRIVVGSFTSSLGRTLRGFTLRRWACRLAPPSSCRLAPLSPSRVAFPLLVLPLLLLGRFILLCSLWFPPFRLPRFVRLLISPFCSRPCFPLLRHLVRRRFPPLLRCLIHCRFPLFAALTFASRPLTLHGWNSRARVSAARACGRGGGGELAWVGPIAFALSSSVGFVSSSSLAFVLSRSLRLLSSSMGFMPSSSLAFVSQPSLGCCPPWDSCRRRWCCCRHVRVGGGAGVRIVVIIWDPLVLTGCWFLSSHPSQEGRGFFPVWLCVFERD